MKATPSRPQTEMLTGRDAAVHVVRRALSGQGFAERGLRALRAGGRLAGRDQSLASETARGALRHFVTIEHVLRRVARYDPRRTSEPLRAILALAAYQVIWLDRVPAFAAVDQAVDQARR